MTFFDEGTVFATLCLLVCLCICLLARKL